MGKNRKRRHQPSDPAEIARKARMIRMNPHMWGENREALSLPQNADVQTTEATRERTARIQRFDCFATLGIPVETYMAVRRYQEQLAIRYGAEGSIRTGEHVDGASAADPVSPRSIRAAETIETLAELMGEPWMLPLIEKLSEPEILRGERANWKAIVRRQIGLIDRDAQARAVKNAAEGVRRAWVDFDNGAMRRAA